MAPKKSKSGDGITIKTTASQFQAAIREAAAASQQAKGASFEKLAAISGCSEDSGFSKATVRFVLQLNDLDELKRDQSIRELLMGIKLMDWGAQGDMFDDISATIKKMEEVDWEFSKPKKGVASPGLPLDEALAGFEAAKEKADEKKRRRKKNGSGADNAPAKAYPPTPTAAETLDDLTAAAR